MIDVRKDSKTISAKVNEVQESFLFKQQRLLGIKPKRISGLEASKDPTKTCKRVTGQWKIPMVEGKKETR